MSLPLYKDIAKAYNDLATEDYAHPQKVGLKIKTKGSGGLELTPSFVLSHSGTALGAFSSKWKYKTVQVEAKTQTDGKASVETKYAVPQVNGLTVIASGSKAAGKNIYESNVGGEYSHANARVKGSADAFSGVVNVNGVFGTSTAGVGLDGTYNAEKGTLTNYNGAAFYNAGDYILAAQTKSLKDKPAAQVALSYFLNYSKAAKIGGEYVYDLGTQAHSFGLASAYQLDANTLFKGKVDSDGKITTHLQQTVHPNVRIGWGSQIDATKLSSDAHKFGFYFTLGDL